MEIKIVGKKETFNLDDVSHLVVKLGTSYYMKDSTEIVKLNGKFYRKKSPLITIDHKGRYITKESAIMTHNGVWATKEDPDLIDIKGRIYLKGYCVQINGVWYDKASPEITKDSFNGIYILKSDAVALDKEFYGESQFVSKTNENYIVAHNGEYIYNGDSVKIMEADGKIKPFHGRDKALSTGRSHGSLPSVFLGFKAGRIGDFEHVDCIKTYSREYALSNGFVLFDELNIWVHPLNIAAVSEAYEKYKTNVLAIRTDNLRREANSRLTDKGSDENQAKIVSTNKFNTFEYRTTPYYYPAFSKTSGMRYTFGVELETSHGRIAPEDGMRLSFSCVRDGSVTGGEYITGVLCGNKGVENLKAITDLLANSTFVNDQCGMHIHVGGSNLRKSDNEYTGVQSEMPVFNRQFSVMAIKLGCMLEDELFSICPPNRHYKTDWGNKYCASIKKYSNINSTNWKEVLGMFVYERPFGVEHNSKKELARYTQGRYKWLNLVNCNSAGRHATIEFRLWPGTTSFEKVYNYLLISLAFVWFVENRPSTIMKGKVKLTDILTEALGKNAVNVMAFIEDRRKKFKK